MFELHSNAERVRKTWMRSKYLLTNAKLRSSVKNCKRVHKRICYIRVAN